MNIKSLMTAAALACVALGAVAQENVVVQNAWVRATVKGQMASGAFMTLTAKNGTKLVGVTSPVADVAQVHEMKMDGGVMKMNEVKGGLDLPAGQPVALKPGGYHIMLLDLKGQLVKDSTVPLTLTFKDAKGAQSQLKLKLTVATTPPGAMAGMDHSQQTMPPAKP